MDGAKAQWFGPGETARRLGVTTKALKVYEREGLIVPHRAESGWRLYGPLQLARLYQIIVLRDLGLPLRSIRELLASQTQLREVLRFQRESLESQQTKTLRAIELITSAERRIDEGKDLSLDDLATLTKETVVQQPNNIQDFAKRLEALVSERDPTGQTSLALEELKQHVRLHGIDESFTPKIREILAEARRLKDTGDVTSEAAKDMVRRLRSLTEHPRFPPKAAVEVMRGAFSDMVADAEARSETLPFDAATLDFIRRVTKGMRESGELAASA
jgi:DNA-binding transcriptional MerR regulator